VPAEVLEALGLQGQSQTVGQAELLPVWIAKRVWADSLRGVHLLTFLDNDSARFALVAGYSPALASARIVGEAAVSDAALGVHQWVARVPSESNPADAPSRLDFEAPEVQHMPRIPLPLVDAEISNWASWPSILRALSV